MSNKKRIQPVILCGGEGLRLWPLSRISFPKQFYDILGKGETNLSHVLRLIDKPLFKDPLIVSNIKLRLLLMKELYRIFPRKKFTVLLEPESKSTAPALSAAVHYLDSINIEKDQPILFLPSDHLFTRGSNLILELKKLAESKFNENIILLGVKPEYPEPDYGYIKFKPSSKRLKEIEKFTEKPELKLARRLFKNSKYLWNSGIFLGKQKTFMGLMEKYYQDNNIVRDSVMDSVISTEGKVNYILLSKAFSEVLKVSFDEAILEKSNKTRVLNVDIGWKDLGSWKSIYNSLKKDKSGNSSFGKDIHSYKVKDSLIYKSNLTNKKEILVSDVSNLLIVDTDDALLVTNLDSKLNFKEVLKNAHIKNIYTTSVFHRPWGHYSNLLSEPNVLVKKITIYPRSSMSLQRHFYRSEHWTILSGKAYVTVGNTRKLYKQNQSVFIEKKVKHRLENPFKKPLEMIEVQIGEAISEKDIERFDDIYDRM